MRAWNGLLRAGVAALIWLVASAGAFAQARKGAADSLLLVVTDPLSRELACACVKGFGQRDYRKLAAYLEKALKQRVSIEYSDDLAETLAMAGKGREVIAIGDRALTERGVGKAGLKSRVICELTDLEGNTSLTGLFIARSDDSARALKDVAGRKIFFGLANGDAKYAGALGALRAVGIDARAEKHLGYSDAALDLLDSDLSPLPIAVIPGYALRLLEACGSVKPGNLRVIGKTEPAPFIAAFVSENIPAAKQEKILGALLAVKGDAALLTALETKEGFKPVKAPANPAPRASAGESWPDWRGPNRDGRVARLPQRLAASPKLVWRKAGMEGSMAGITVSDGRALCAERDFAEEHDVYRCLDANTGEMVWRIAFPAKGKKLDYGQSPRAVPVMHGGQAYLLGAFGDLRCVNVADGNVVWERQLMREFKAPLPTWGACSPPLVVDDLLIVNPGATDAALAALDLKTGRTRWVTPGAPSSYSAFIDVKFGDSRQIVGYDANSIGGWDAKTGKRLWRLTPPVSGDFNVPTPIAMEGGFLAATENNGTRYYRFDTAGQIISKPVAAFADLSPDTATPVVTCGRVFGADRSLYCLDIRNGLSLVWHLEEEVGDHASLMADDERVLVVTLNGGLILLDAKADKNAILSRAKLFEDEVEVYSHPALVGSRLYARGGTRIVCVDLQEESL